MSEPVQELTPKTARQIFVWQLLFISGLLILNNFVNALSDNYDFARAGVPMQSWKPFVWEFSSALLMWLLAFPVVWWLKHFPLTRSGWWRSLPAHILATVPFSLIHVGGMVLVRDVAYRALGTVYDYGPWWPNWFYEYKKDCVSYAIMLAIFSGFHIYGLWLDSRGKAGAPAELEPKQEGAPRERLVVRKLNREFILEMGEIDRIEADGNYVVIHAGGQDYRLRESLEGLAKRLDEQRFARVHRAHVVNIDRIREIQPWDHGDYRIVLKDGSFVNFSRRYRSRLNHLFQ